jgi:flagellin
MPVTISTLAQTFTANRLNRIDNDLSTSSERLSSAKRINRASDDAAGLAIAAQFASQLLGSQQAYRNSNDAISYTQTAEGALGELSDINQRVRELSVQASNGIYSDSDRQAIQAEVEQLQGEAQRILEGSEFNGRELFTGNDSIDFQVGNDAGDTVTVGSQNILQQFTDSGFFDIDVSTAAGASSALSVTDSSISVINDARSNYGAVSSRFESIGRNLQVESENLAAAQSRIMDADYAVEVANRTRSLIQQNAGLANLAQANLNSGLATYLLK